MNESNLLADLQREREKREREREIERERERERERARERENLSISNLLRERKREITPSYLHKGYLVRAFT